MFKILRAEVEDRKEYIKHEEPDDRACYVTLSYASAGRKVRESVAIGVSDMI